MGPLNPAVPNCSLEDSNCDNSCSSNLSDILLMTVLVSSLGSHEIYSRAASMGDQGRETAADSRKEAIYCTYTSVKVNLRNGPFNGEPNFNQTFFIKLKLIGDS